MTDSDDTEDGFEDDGDESTIEDGGVASQVLSSSDLILREAEGDVSTGGIAKMATRSTRELSSLTAGPTEFNRSMNSLAERVSVSTMLAMEDSISATELANPGLYRRSMTVDTSDLSSKLVGRANADIDSATISHNPVFDGDRLPTPDRAPKEVEKEEPQSLQELLEELDVNYETFLVIGLEMGFVAQCEECGDRYLRDNAHRLADIDPDEGRDVRCGRCRSSGRSMQ